MNDNPPCFGQFGNPFPYPETKILKCDNCNRTIMCKRKLQSNIEQCVRILKLTPKYATIDYDLWKIPYSLKRGKVDEENLLLNLFKKYADKTRRSYYFAGITAGQFKILRKNLPKFVTELKEILTNLNNLEPIRTSYQTEEKR